MVAIVLDVLVDSHAACLSSLVVNLVIKSHVVHLDFIS